MEHTIDADKSLAAGKKFLSTALSSFRKEPVNYSLAYNIALMGVENFLAGILSARQIEIDGHGVNYLVNLTQKNGLLQNVDLETILRVDQILSPHHKEVTWPDETLQTRFLALLDELINKDLI